MTQKMELILETNLGKIIIPLLSLKDLDDFTMRYNSREELLDKLIHILELPLTKKDIGKIYAKNVGVEYDLEEYIDLLPLRYSKDNYDEQSLIEAYAAYLKRDPQRLNGYGVKNVFERISPNTDPKYVEERIINVVAKTFIGNNYRRKRELYFLVTEAGLYVKINKVMQENTKDNNDRLRHVESKKDDYLQYLIELSSRGDDDYAKAMEELSLMDIEDLQRYLTKTDRKVIDGLKTYDFINRQDVVLLEELTEMNIDSLKYLCHEQLKNGRKR